MGPNPSRYRDYSVVTHSVITHNDTQQSRHIELSRSKKTL